MLLVVVTDAKRRIVERLQRLDGATAADLAEDLGLTGAAVRQHLDGLADLGLAAKAEVTRPGGRGRPAQRWVLTPLARSLFPDRHADLTVELLDLVRDELGEAALDQLIDGRTRRQRRAYDAALATAEDLRDRAVRLAGVRSAEGYAAEVVDAPDGDGLLLVERHCPICEAATACQGLCRSELEVFRAVLGAGAEVHREQHLLAGDTRCTYRIRSPRAGAGAAAAAGISGSGGGRGRARR
jgi:predicted ArsR family transcriptional regulator